MITQIILFPFFALVKAFLVLIPVISVPSGFILGFDTFFTVLATAGYFLPLNTISILLSFFIIWYGFVFVVSGVNWIIGKIPTLS